MASISTPPPLSLGTVKQIQESGEAVDFSPFWAYQQHVHHHAFVANRAEQALNHKVKERIVGSVITLLMIAQIAGIVLGFTKGNHWGSLVGHSKLGYGLGSTLAFTTLLSLKPYATWYAGRIADPASTVGTLENSIADLVRRENFASSDGHEVVWLKGGRVAELQDGVRFVKHVAAATGFCRASSAHAGPNVGYLHDGMILGEYVPTKAPFTAWNLLGFFARPQQAAAALEDAQTKRDEAEENAKTWFASADIQARLQTRRDFIMGNTNTIRSLQAQKPKVRVGTDSFDYNGIDYEPALVAAEEAFDEGIAKAQANIDRTAVQVEELEALIAHFAE